MSKIQIILQSPVMKNFICYYHCVCFNASCHNVNNLILGQGMWHIHAVSDGRKRLERDLKGLKIETIGIYTIFQWNSKILDI